MRNHDLVKVAVIGLGRSGWDIHVARMRGDARFQIVAVADFEADRISEAEAELGCRPFKRYRDMLKSTDAELVVVSSYSSTHAPIACDVLASGRHALVEKPVAMSVRQVQRTIDTATENGKRFFPFHNYRYTKDYRHLREVMASRLLGEVFEVRIRLLDFSRRNDWQTLRKNGGGVLNNTCPHFLDIALQLLESRVVEVFSDLKLTTDVGDAEDHVRIIVKGQNGRVVDLLASTSCAFPEPKWTVLGTCGTLTSDGTTSHIKCFDPSKLGPLSVRDGPALDRKYANDDRIPWEEKTVPSAGAVPHDLYDNLYAVLREGGDQDIPPEEIIEVVRITERARRKDGFYGGIRY